MTNMLWGSVRKVLWKRCSLRNICYEQSIWKQIEKTLLGNCLKIQKTKKNTKKRTKENQKKTKKTKHTKKTKKKQRKQKNQRNQKNQKNQGIWEKWPPKPFPETLVFFVFFVFFVCFVFFVFFGFLDVFCFFFSRFFCCWGLSEVPQIFFQRNVFFVKRCISVVLCICFHLTLAIPSQNPKTKKSWRTPKKQEKKEHEKRGASQRCFLLDSWHMINTPFHGFRS